jgi:hypothetical protein
LTKTQSDNAQDGEDDGAKDSKQEQRKSLRRSWRASGPVAKATVVFAGISAAATVLYCAFAGWTLYEIHSGGADTKAIASAAGLQAEAAGKIAGAAKAQSAQAEAQTTKMGESLTKTDSLITATNNLATQAQRSANIANDSLTEIRENFKKEQRAWIGLGVPQGQIDPEKPFVLNIPLINSGRTPAIMTEYAVSYGFSAVSPVRATEPVDFGYAPGPAIAPQGNFTIGVTNRAVVARYQEIMSKKTFLFFIGVFRYHDTYSSIVHSTKFCMSFDIDRKEMASCENGNDIQ